MCVLGPNCSQWCRYPGPQKDVWSTDCAASACPGSVVGRAGGYAPGAGSGPVQAARGAAWLGWATDTSVRKPGRSGASSPLFSHRMTKRGWSTIFSGGSQGHNCNHPVVDVEVWLKWCLQGYPGPGGSVPGGPAAPGGLYGGAEPTLCLSPIAVEWSDCSLAFHREKHSCSTWSCWSTL